MATEVNLTIPPESPTVFSNTAFVQNTPTEIIIRFCLIDPVRGKSVRKDDGSDNLAEVEAPAVVSVFLPMPIAERLARAITTQVSTMKKMAGRASGNG